MEHDGPQKGNSEIPKENEYTRLRNEDTREPNASRAEYMAHAMDPQVDRAKGSDEAAHYWEDAADDIAAGKEHETSFFQDADQARGAAKAARQQAEWRALGVDQAAARGAAEYDETHPDNHGN